MFSPKEKPSKPAFTGFGLSNSNEKKDKKEEPAFKGSVGYFECILIFVFKGTIISFKAVYILKGTVVNLIVML